MLQVAAFRVPDEQEKANEFLRTHAHKEVDLTQNDTLLVLFEDGAHSPTSLLNHLVELREAIVASRFQQEVAVITLTHERPRLEADVKELEAKLETELKELEAKLQSTPTSRPEWDEVMNELAAAKGEKSTKTNETRNQLYAAKAKLQENIAGVDGCFRAMELQNAKEAFVISKIEEAMKSLNA